MQRLRPLNDFIFKKLFGETENIDNLKSFLNAVLNKDKTQELVELEIINEKELTTDNIQDKKGIIVFVANIKLLGGLYFVKRQSAQSTDPDRRSFEPAN